MPSPGRPLTWGDGLPRQVIRLYPVSACQMSRLGARSREYIANGAAGGAMPAAQRLSEAVGVGLGRGIGCRAEAQVMGVGRRPRRRRVAHSRRFCRYASDGRCPARMRGGRKCAAVGASDDLGRAASHRGVGETTVTPTRPCAAAPHGARQGHSVGKPCRQNYVAKLGLPYRLRYSQVMPATRLITAAAHRRGQLRPGRPYPPPARRAGFA